MSSPKNWIASARGRGADGYGATVRTLRQFIKSYHDLVGAVRDIVLPGPDVKPTTSA